MCGIVGIFDTRSTQAIDRSLLERMNERQHHRGPDEGGVHLEPGIGLGHRRLSIIDLASGQQPLYNDDRSVVTVYNGEIYNFKQLRKELEALGHVFRTSSDTEVLVRSWEQWGARSVERLRGMFAYAIWDRKQETLFLARDRLGIKPLYYSALPDGRVLFASELKALMVCADLPSSIDARAVEDFFAYGYIPEPKTIFQNVHKLKPAHTLILRRGESISEQKPYWDIPFCSVGRISEEEAAEELMHRLREAVKIRMISEVPLGAFLSGGVDSSAVVGMMSEVSDDPVNTCSVSFGDPAFNETQYAMSIAERFGTNHYVEQVDSDDFDLVDILTDIYDEPYADSSAIPTYRVCELARRRVTVALSGDGGDENLAGYRRYPWHTYEERVRSMVPQWMRTGVFGTLGAIYPKADWAPRVFRAKSTFQALAKDSLGGYLQSVGIVPDHLRSQLFSSGFKRDLQGYHAVEVLREHARNSPTDCALSRAQYLDLKTYLPGDILTKVDRASMAHSLEVRVPILDHECVEWMSGLPPHFKLRGGEGKYIFKKSLEKMLPSDILYRPKMGFSVPVSKWFRGPLRGRLRESLSSSGLKESGIFDQNVIAKLVDQHQSGVREHGAVLWALLMFEAFQRKLLAQS